MILLLDTHVAAWGWTLDRRLHRVWHERLVKPSNRVLVSAITPWEMGIKHASGRWPEVGIILSRWEALMDESGFEQLPMTSRHGLGAAALDWAHRDPFDRILAAQSRLEGARLVTADAWMLAYLPDALNPTEG